MTPTISARPQRIRRLTRLSLSRTGARPLATGWSGRSGEESGVADMSRYDRIGIDKPNGTEFQRNQRPILPLWALQVACQLPMQRVNAAKGSERVRGK